MICSRGTRNADDAGPCKRGKKLIITPAWHGAFSMQCTCASTFSRFCILILSQKLTELWTVVPVIRLVSDTLNNACHTQIYILTVSGLLTNTKQHSLTRLTSIYAGINTLLIFNFITNCTCVLLTELYTHLCLSITWINGSSCIIYQYITSVSTPFLCVYTILPSVHSYKLTRYYV